MREEHDEEFQAFCERYGDDTATGMLEDICCQETSREWPWRIEIYDYQTRDREGANATISGYVYFRAKTWGFVIDNGNWNGTVVRIWERASRLPLKEMPAQSAWLFASREAVSVRLVIDGMEPLVARMMTKILKRMNTNGATK
jgi:hypothetical protein